MPFREKNKIIIAVAGSGKTTTLVKSALESPEKKILFLTYTNENLDNIKKCFQKEGGGIPANVTIATWFSFLLKDGVRPYHNSVSAGSRVTSIHFIEGSSQGTPLRFVREADTERFYFDDARRIYTDKISQYVEKCNNQSDGAVIKRLEQIYDSIYIDEVQDLAGYDLEILKLLFSSSLEITLVGDPRQVTYLTNHSRKNSQYRGDKIVDFFRELETANMCHVVDMTLCHRCNQAICSLADLIYPSLAVSTSGNAIETGHDGIFKITQAELEDYITEHQPVLLKHNARSNTFGKPARNFGTTKGLTFDRVLIFPTNDMKVFFRSRNASGIAEGTKAKLYVAITRARYSVAFVD